MANARRLTRPQGENDLTGSALRQANHELRQLVDFLPQHVIVLNADGTLIHANQTLLDFFGRTLEEMQGAGTTERVKRDVHPDDLERVQSERKNGFSKELRLSSRKRLLGKDGRYRWFLFRYKPMRDENGAVLSWYATATDIEDRKRTESLLAAEMRTLQMIADGASLTEVLNHVCTSIDLQIAPSVTTILLIDSSGQKLWPAAGPKLPQAWIPAITPVPVTRDGGLCATAAFLKTRVVVADVLTEPNWREEFRDVAIRNGIRAAWSEPILTKDNQVLGTFAVYSAESRVPTDADLALIEAGGRLALFALERHRTQSALQQSNRELRQVIDFLPQQVAVLDAEGSLLQANQTMLDYFGRTLEGMQGAGTGERIKRDVLSGRS